MYKRASAALTAVLWAGVAGLTGCAATTADTASDVSSAASAAAPANPAPRIAVSPVSVGTWYDLGTYQAPWLAGDGPVPVAGPNVPTRVVGWQREADPQDQGSDEPASQNEWLAIVIVQVAPGAHAPCPAQASSLDVINAGAGCLRLRRNADFDHWLQAAQPALYRWVDDHGWTSLPRAWVGYRLPSAQGGTIEVHALFAPSLIEPTTRNAADFITGGLPGQQWARQLAAAVRARDSAANNAFAVPPFPFTPGPRTAQEAALPDVLPSAPRTGASAPTSASSAVAPAVAEQVTPAPSESSPSQTAPRQDEE
ncbi:MAG: hypothetical protein LBU72_00165 [Burkholderiaceae bacterium]|jgi:hypothetical protein|nr:hypothetical protein [Burkholderiaceae bacterium]